MENLLQAAASLSDYNSVRDFLYGLRYHGAKYGLERMVSFSDLLSNPQEKLCCVHVAGTNGKGSTCSMIEAILRANGCKTGFYSSPHLIRQGERIQVNREIMTEDEIVFYTKDMVKLLLDQHELNPDMFPSFFEFMTAMGFLKFSREDVDVAVIETGLGGRLDATNVLSPKVTVITSISLDHTSILGNDIETIAVEKAGIIKKGVPLVIGHIPEKAEIVLRKKADQMGAKVYSVREKWGEDIAQYPKTNLRGPHQQINAAMAMIVADLLSNEFKIDHDINKRALESIDWPGRWEELKLNDGKTHVVLDSSHNEEGARMLDSNLQELTREHQQKPIIVTGSLGDDRARHLMEVICKYTDHVFVVQPHQPRALSTEEMRACAPDDYKGTISPAKVEDLFDYQKCLINTNSDQPVLVTGSIYLIGEISELIKSDKRVDQQGLQDVI